MNTPNFAESVLGKTFEGVIDYSNADMVNNILDQFKLNWRVEKEPLFMADGRASGFFAVVRQDNGHPFMSCTGNYIPFQNSELAEMLIRMSEKEGFELHSGGQLAGGKRVFIQLKSQNKLTGIGKNNTTVQGFLTGINSHNGTSLLKWGETNFTICCENTFAAANKELKNSSAHDEDIHKRVEIAIKEVHRVMEQELIMFQNFERLSNIKATRQDLQKVIATVTGVDILLNKDEALDLYGGRKMDKADGLLTSIVKEMNQKGATMWGLFSGVTNYTTHKLNAPDRENGKIESILVGTAYEQNNKAYNLVLDLTGLN